jgi:hypothetical protein
VVGNFTVNSGGTIVVNGPTTVNGNLSLTAGDASATSIIDDNLGALSVTGTTTVASSGGVVLDGANDFGTLMFNGITGASTFSDINNLTVSGNATGAMTVTAGGAGGVPGPWALTLGTMNVGSLIATAGTGGGGDSGTVTQLADTALHVENTASFKSTNANIVIGNNGNSFGRVAVDAGNGAVTLVEDGTLKLGNLIGRGSSSITSRFGSIIEDSANDNSISNNGTLTLNAVNGSISIGNTTHTAGVTVGNLTAVVLNAPNGSASIITNNTVSLGATNVNSLAVMATNNITQSAGVKVFGSATFNSTAGNVVLSNSTNNFGRLSLTVGGASRNITITEGGTLNLGTVSMPANSSGNFSATSLSGDIVDNGFGGVKFGGTIVGQTANVGTGIVTLVASNGNIVLDDLTTEFVTNGGVVFNAQNVTLKPLGQSTIYLGAAGTSSVAGNLTVQSSVGSIANNGDLNISGNASFETGTGNISVTSAGNRFGTVQFVGNQVSISQVNDMNIVRGSQAIGQAQLASTGSYITIAEGTGLVSFGNTVSMVASGNITLPDALQAVGQLSVNASGTKDLSALSVSGDLNGQVPVNLGTGAYVPPQN